jgi:hypothetical protein
VLETLAVARGFLGVRAYESNPLSVDPFWIQT